jgi:hypothetical protein
MNIDINAERIILQGEDEKSLSYERICELAGKPGQQLTVTYFWRGHGDSTRQGSPHAGQSITPADGMVITAMFTGNA